ncbi:MAG: hypothetical protein ACRDLF_10500 [Solirubrobacteraceae bacterium]
MTDTFANGPSAPGDAAPQQTGDVTGTLAELERKLRELERELTSIGRRREPTSESPAPDTASAAGAPTPPSGRLVDEAIEPPTPIKPLAPIEPAGSGQPVKFVRPLESARPQISREPAGRSEPPARSELPAGSELHTGGEPHTPSEPYKPSEPRGEHLPQPTPEPGERPRPSEAQLASLAELRRFRDRLERFARDLAAEYDALLSRVMTGLTSASPPPASLPSSETQPGSPPAAHTPPAPTPPAGAPPADAPASREETLFEGRVELGVGPFYDIASLSAFERRLASLPHVSEASVRRFEASHAVVDLRLAAPVALVRELRRTGETDFNVREVADGRLLLTFDDG